MDIDRIILMKNKKNWNYTKTNKASLKKQSEIFIKMRQRLEQMSYLNDTLTNLNRHLCACIMQEIISMLTLNGIASCKCSLSCYS